MKRRAVALAIAGLALIASCTVPALDLSEKKCRSAADCAGDETCAGDGACVASVVTTRGDAGGSAVTDYCKAIPRFTGAQNVDGDASDLASLPAVSYPWNALVSAGGLTVSGDKLDTVARIGWSALGVHLYFHVTYETGTVIVPGADDPLWFGDALEMFLKGDGMLTGGYGDGLDPGALQIIVVPDPTNPPRTEMAVSYGMNLGPLTGAEVAVARDASGYAVEALVPWSRISAPDAGAQGPGAGATIGFQLGLDYRDREADASTQPQYQLTLPLGQVAGPTPCPSEQPIPSCDDRTWCAPTLLP